MKLLSVLSLVFLLACSATKNSSTVLVDTPFSGIEYMSDNDYYRYVQSATHSNKTMAEKLAEMNAKTGLASLISIDVSAVTENYVKATNVDGNEELVEHFRQVINSMVCQDLHNVKVLGKTVQVEKDDCYTAWVALEVPKVQVKDQIVSRLSQESDFNPKVYDGLFEK